MSFYMCAPCIESSIEENQGTFKWQDSLYFFLMFDWIEMILADRVDGVMHGRCIEWRKKVAKRGKHKLRITGELVKTHHASQEKRWDLEYPADGGIVGRERNGQRQRCVYRCKMCRVHISLNGLLVDRHVQNEQCLRIVVFHSFLRQLAVYICLLNHPLQQSLADFFVWSHLPWHIISFLCRRFLKRPFSWHHAQCKRIVVFVFIVNQTHTHTFY